MINPVGSTLQGLNNQDLMVLDGIVEGNEKDLSGCRKDVLFMLNNSLQEWSVILLEIVSPGIHLVKKLESQSRTIETQFKKQRVRNWKSLGLYVTKQLLNLKTDSKTLYHSLLTLKYSLPIETTKMNHI